jgi:hypothetical protein
MKHLGRTIILLAFIGHAHAQEAWDRVDAALGATALTATVIDWGQTRYIAKNPCANAGGGTSCTDPYREVGWARYFIGERPSTGQVDAYFTAAIVAGTLAAHYLPSPYRKWFLGGVALVELSVVRHNIRIGLKVEI